MKSGICSDHAGVEYKTRLISSLVGKGYDVVNFGTNSAESCDYPDFAHAMGNAMDKGEISQGIAICGTGNGMALCLNRHPSVRACIAWNRELAAVVKSHNNANVLVMPARYVSYRMVVMMVHAWLTTEFAGGRHQRRIDKILIK